MEIRSGGGAGDSHAVAAESRSGSEMAGSSAGVEAVGSEDVPRRRILQPKRMVLLAQV